LNPGSLIATFTIAFVPVIVLVDLLLSKKSIRPALNLALIFASAAAIVVGFTVFHHITDHSMIIWHLVS
jgi:hypothetical protein